jgi:DNA-binding transcriptional ArsR family regulator
LPRRRALSTTSRHLGRLADAGLVTIRMQTRHHYFRQSGVDVASVLQGPIAVAARTGHLRARTGPRDPELQRARVCSYDLAGDAAVRITTAARRRHANNGTVTDEGERSSRRWALTLMPLPAGDALRACPD